MTQSIIPATRTFALKDQAYFHACHTTLRTAAALATLLSLGRGRGQVINTDELAGALKEGLEEGKKAGTKLTCTGFAVFLNNEFVKFVFGIILIASLFGLGWAWYQNTRPGGNGGFLRLFIVLVGGLALIGVVGSIYTKMMGC